jgi:UDP-glucose 4-epimerase
VKAFVTGVAGFLGCNLAALLKRQGHWVGGCDNLLGGDQENVPPGVNFHKVDCCDLRGLKGLVRGMDVVYHLAASPHEGLSVFSPCLVTRNTYLSTVTVAAAAADCGVKAVVFASSMARYGKGQAPPPFVESMAPAPVDPYGISKVAAEDVLACMARAHGFRQMVVVPHNVLGEGQKFDDPYRNVAAIMVNRMLRGQQPVIYGDGSQRRCFSHVDDVVGPMAKAGELLASGDGLNGQVVNVGPDGDFISVLDLARALAEIVGFGPLEPVFVPPRPLEVAGAYCSSDKARSLLGYETRVQTTDSLRRLVEWVRRNGARPFKYHLPIEVNTRQVPATWRERTI